MKKDELLGMEVYYEDNPQQCEPRGHKGVEGVQGIPAPKPEGVWVFGDSDEDEEMTRKVILVTFTESLAITKFSIMFPPSR